MQTPSYISQSKKVSLKSWHCTPLNNLIHYIYLYIYIYIYIYTHTTYTYESALCVGLYIVLDISKVALDFEDGGFIIFTKIIPSLLHIRHWSMKKNLWTVIFYWREGRQVALIPVCLSHPVMYNSATPWTVVHQPPLSVEFCRQEYWSG